MKNTLKLFLVLTLLAGAPAAMGQYGFGTNSPDASAAVDISSTTMGFLPPRMAAAQIAAIPNPADGLEVFNSTLNCLSFCVGGQFRCVAPSTSTSYTVSITTQPVSSASGTTVATKVTTNSGATVIYQWYCADDASGTNFRPIVGACSATFPNDVSC